jgi:Protein of unknown function (DUF3124)
MKKLVFLILVVSFSSILFTALYAQKKFIVSKVVYVPAYSSIFHGDDNRKFNLAVTLSIRNTDMSRSFTITSVEYFDTDGKLVRTYLDKPKIIKPLESVSFIVKESDDAGGHGANFIVRWNSNQKINTPIIESVMISTTMQQGISFTSRGVEITESN